MSKILEAKGPSTSGASSTKAVSLKSTKSESGNNKSSKRYSLKTTDKALLRSWYSLMALGRALDERAPAGPWTRQVLELIEAKPAVRAADLSRHLGREKLDFKADVRKLKALGLTESLEVGYRLSPRGAALLARLRAELLTAP